MAIAQRELKPISVVSGEPLSEAVYESLLEAIVSGQLAPGTVLSASQLSGQLEVSRTPIHEALWMLGSDGLVDVQSGRRARVASFTRDDLWEIFEMRRLLEGPAAERAAGRMDRRQWKPLRDAADELERETGAPDWTMKWSHFDEVFHATIANNCGNGRLADDVARYRLVHRGFNRVSTDEPSLLRALQEHLEILDAIERRDGPRARAAMESHITAWQEYFVERFPER